MSDATRLLDWLRPHTAGGIALAFSGGVDSAVLLAALARLLREAPFPCRALTLRTPLQAQSEADEARALAASLGVPWRLIEANPLTHPAVVANAPDRCYHCKRLLFERLRAETPDHALLIDGTNADDRRSDDRPGLRALDELGVRSPLADLGLSKPAVRALAHTWGLSVADRPAAPCLATRFPTSAALSEERLRHVEAAEAAFRTLLPEIRDFRVRDHGPLARIQVPAADLPCLLAARERLLPALRPFYPHITLDLSPLHG